MVKLMSKKLKKNSTRRWYESTCFFLNNINIDWRMIDVWCPGIDRLIWLPGRKWCIWAHSTVCTGGLKMATVQHIKATLSGFRRASTLSPIWAHSLGMYIDKFCRVVSETVWSWGPIFFKVSIWGCNFFFLVGYGYRGPSIYFFLGGGNFFRLVL